MNRDDLIGALKEIFPSGTWPKPLHILQALSLTNSGSPFRDAAKSVGTTHASVLAASQTGDPVRAVLGLALNEIEERSRERAGQMLGQLLLGRCAEIAFERIYKSEMHSEEFELRDLREGRTDTDYRLHNGRGRPIYRVNIKFHGSRFRRASEMVRLDPADCFALATYKIASAMEKQSQEGLPYFFAIVGVPNLTGESVGRDIPPSLVETVALIDQAPKGKSKRDIEDAVVQNLVTIDHPVFHKTLEQILTVDCTCFPPGVRTSSSVNYFLIVSLRCACAGSRVFSDEPKSTCIFLFPKISSLLNNSSRPSAKVGHNE